MNEFFEVRDTLRHSVGGRRDEGRVSDPRRLLARAAGVRDRFERLVGYRHGDVSPCPRSIHGQRVIKANLVRRETIKR